MRTLLRFVLCLTMVFSLTGCALEPTGPLVPLTEVTVGVAPAVQPETTIDLLAGYIPEDRKLASTEALLYFDGDMLTMIKQNCDSARIIKAIPVASVTASSRKAGENTALTLWVKAARKANVELLIVPQILDWREREGGALGVTAPAKVFVQFYLINAKTGELVSRSVFNEQQQSLAGDLLNVRTFFKRGGKWLTAQELSREGIMNMIKEFGL